MPIIKQNTLIRNFYQQTKRCLVSQHYQPIVKQNVGIQRDYSAQILDPRKKANYLKFMGKIIVDFATEEGEKQSGDVQHDERLIELNVVIRVLRKRPNVGTFDRFYHFYFVII